MITLKEIALITGVSVSTVSAVLNRTKSRISISKNTKKKVLKVGDELGYYPNIFARSLRTRVTGIVAVIVTDITDPYFSVIIDGTEKALEKNGYYFLLITAQNSPEKETQYLQKLRKSRVDGLLVMSAIMRFTDSMVHELSTSKIPIVLIARKPPHQDISSVEMDNVRGGFVATEHLITSGHRDIIHITTSYDRPDAEDRLSGYRQAMERHGLAKRCQVMRGGDTPESGYEMVTRILQKDKKPTAIFTFNDSSAFGAIKGLKNNGVRVPQDISVVGFDDISHSAYYSPSLTTIRQPSLKMGRLGAELLLKAVEKREARLGKHIVFSPELIVRESSSIKPE